MIKEVVSGQKLTTNLVNEIIKACNGNDIPTNGEFQNTSKGTLYINNPNLNKKTPYLRHNTFLDVKIQKTYPLVGRPFNYNENKNLIDDYVFVNLGATLHDFKRLVTVNSEPPDHIFFIHKANPDLNYEFENNELFEPTQADEVKSCYKINDGYINTGIRANDDNIFYEFLKIDEINPETKEIIKTETGFVITDFDVYNESEHTDLINRFKELIGYSPSDENAVVKGYEATALFNYTLSSSLDGEHWMHTYVQNSTKKNCVTLDPTYVDSDQEIDQYSIQYRVDKNAADESKFLQLYHFNLTSNEPYYAHPDYFLSQVDGNSTGNAIVIRKVNDMDGCEIDYMDVASISNYVDIPTADSEYGDVSQTKSIELIKAREKNNNAQPYFQLYEFDNGETQTAQADLVIGESKQVELSDGYNKVPQFLYRYADDDGNMCLGYAKITIKQVPDEFDGEGWDEQLSDIWEVLSDLTSEVSALSDGLSRLSNDISAALSGNFWIRGSDETTNYGSMIGDSSGEPVINLDDCQLYGRRWLVNSDLYVDGNEGTFVDFNAGGFTYMYGQADIEDSLEVGVKTHLNAGLVVKDFTSDDGPTITLGNTTINETQLQQLLALI